MSVKEDVADFDLPAGDCSRRGRSSRHADKFVKKYLFASRHFVEKHQGGHALRRV